LAVHLQEVNHLAILPALRPASRLQVNRRQLEEEEEAILNLLEDLPVLLRDRVDPAHSVAPLVVHLLVDLDLLQEDLLEEEQEDLLTVGSEAVPLLVHPELEQEDLLTVGSEAALPLVDPELAQEDRLTVDSEAVHLLELEDRLTVGSEAVHLLVDPELELEDPAHSVAPLAVHLLVE